MKELNSIEDWEKILDESKEHSVVIYKHSSTCSISAGAYARLYEADSENKFPYPINMVVVQTAREVSNKITEDLDVKHESPQVIVVKEGRAVYDASHQAIDLEEILEHLS